LWDLFIGVLAGVISGLLVFWLLSRRTPRIRIMEITQTDRIRIQVQNIRRDGVILKGPSVSAVQNFAELHIVNSIVLDDPPYSRPVRLRRNDPLVIKPGATFVFVSSETTEALREQIEEIARDWAARGRDVSQIGFRFRLFSRDGFSNTPEMVTKAWKL
jgi:hypothetical protein